MDDLTYEDFARAMRALLEEVHWRSVPAADAPHTPDAVYATAEGVLTLPHLGTLRCYQLNTGERVFDADDVARLLGFGDAEDPPDA